MPATKHLWWGLGIRPIDKRSFGDLLKAKNSVVLVPGGLSECMIMKKGQHISIRSVFTPENSPSSSFL